MTPTEQVIHYVEQIVAPDTLSPQSVTRALGAPLGTDPSTTNDFYSGYIATLAHGVFSRVEYREPVPGAAAPNAPKILTLTVRRDPPVTRAGLENHYGVRPPSQILPQGLTSTSYTRGHLTLHFTYLTAGMVLHQVVVESH